MRRALLSAVTTLASVVAAYPGPLEFPGQQLEKRQACTGNTADDRQTWCGYDISTNYYDEVPDTGVTREYWLELGQLTLAPDGVERLVMTVNGTIPGPTIIADWGDTLIIHITNNIAVNGTSIHWHGIRQNYTNPNDGAVSITQCAQAPNDTYTYTFRATQYGTTWYHSHFSLQAWEGVFGGIIINGPASANYDEDLGTITLTDWFHETVNSLFDAEEAGGPPTADNGLINGTNVYGEDGSANQTGSRFETTFEAGTSYRLRLINTAIDTMWKFSIDNHTMTVISMDLVPVKPFNTTIVTIGIAQRYDVIVVADQEDIATDFWMRAIPQTACSSNAMADNILGIVHYGSSSGTPNTTGYAYVDSCDDMSSEMVPYVAIDAASGPFYEELEEVSLGLNSDNLARWFINDSAFQVEWGNPTLLQVLNNDGSWNTSQNVIQLDESNEWQYIIIETTLAITHPIHLHGHDFYVLAQDTGTYNSSVALNLSNPPRRDTAMLPASGFLVLAWETDNPGAWLMHCHIGWHTVEGLALQFVERFSEISALVNSTSLEGNCASWDAYQTEDDIVEEDDGI